MSISCIFSGIRGTLLIVICLAIIELSFGENRVCGPGLRQAMEVVCPNGFNGYKTKRNSLTLDEDLNNEDTSSEDFDFGLSLDMFPFFTSSNEINGLAKTRRRRHGVAHECCSKSCKYSEMKAYCRP